MKKYFLSLIAFTLAVGFSSFNNLTKRTTTTFHYVPPANTYDQASVEDVSNWDSGAQTCTGIADKACIIVVDNQNLDALGNLDPARVTIFASDPNSNGTYLVSNLALDFPNGASFSNRQ
jgi:hypothetical protein